MILAKGDNSRLKCEKVKDPNGAEFPPFVDYLPVSGLVELKLFRDGFETFSSLVSIDNLFSELPGYPL